MGGASKGTHRRDHLRLVEPPPPADLPLVVTDPAAREEFEQLTQALLDAVIEIMDLADGDSEIERNGDESEPNGDETEPDDGL